VKDGYLVRESLIQGAPLARLRDALDEVEAAEFEAADGSRSQGRDWIPRYLFDKHADFHTLINFEPLLSVARAVLGPFVRIRQLAARVSYPGEQEQFTRWHHHQPVMPDPVPAFFSFPHKLDCLIYLNDLNDANGPLALAPGSHQRIHDELALEDYSDLAGQQLLRAPAGTCVILHGNLWHRALPTRPDGEKRRVLILSYGPTWMRKSPFGDKPENSLMDRVIEEADPTMRELLGIGGYQ
jgi:ectoine hydroxylase-related dioxygenase (phytanoyl-CoA dioxygenase family)